MLPTLYLIATPIGNLEDITLRALRIMREEVVLIACEDTRTTQKLLNHFQIQKPLISYHEHNESTRTADLISAMERDGSIALVSDAGTPLISDPGYRLVQAAIEKGFPVIPLPGASAALVALAGAGLPTDQFRFAGFLPAKTGARRRALEALADEPATTIVYESPHRILETLLDMSQILGERKIALARELTKMHEEFLRGTADTIREELERRPSVKGEITLVIGGGEQSEATGDPVAEVLRLEEELGMERMEAIKLVAKRQGLPKRDLYRMVIG